jgi:hypothetical protein
LQRTERDAGRLGTAARFPVGGDVAVMLPLELCWAYPAREDAGVE